MLFVFGFILVFTNGLYAGATAAGMCNLCQAGTYQTITGQHTIDFIENSTEAGIAPLPCP